MGFGLDGDGTYWENRQKIHSQFIRIIQHVASLKCDRYFRGSGVLVLKDLAHFSPSNRHALVVICTDALVVCRISTTT